MKKAGLEKFLFCVVIGVSTFLCNASTPNEQRGNQTSQGNYNLPASFSHQVEPIETVDVIVTEDVNLAAIHLEDQERERWGGPYRFAVRHSVEVDVNQGGVWEQIDSETLLWRLHVVSPEATSLSLGFTTYSMPLGGKLFVYSSDGKQVLGPYTERDNALHRQLWTPLIYSDDIVAELTIPVSEVASLELTLGAINHGYRGINPLMIKDLGDSDWCEVDVNCPEGNNWRDQIRSVARYSITRVDGSYWCTGVLINNTAQDDKPYFLTAFHCFDANPKDGVIENPTGYAASMVVYWNFQASTCDGFIGPENQNQTGAYFRAAYCRSDFVLVELDEMPLCSFGVYYAGWDRSSSAPSSGVAIHHPQGDIKKISVENHSLTSADAVGLLPCTTAEDLTHLKVSHWEKGTTESGSSGCPFFNPSKRVVGQLSGGTANCDTGGYDKFGRFYRSWTGGGTNSVRLSNWLDLSGTGALTLDGKNSSSARPCESCEPEDAYLGTIGTVVWGYSVSGNCGNCGKWVGQFVGEAGKTYHFDLCPDSPGSGTASFNADIKITNSSCGIITGQNGVCSSPLYLPNDFQWTCLSNGTYYVIIAPYNSYNSHTCGGTASDTFTLKYYKCSPPAAPATLTVPATDADGVYTVNWAASSVATSYQLESSAPAAGTTIYPLWVQVYSGTAITYNENVGGGNWSYRVKATNACGSSGWTTVNSCVVSDCLKNPGGSDPNYIDWKTWRYPACWCYQYQCRSDINGKKTGGFRVQALDLAALAAAYNKTDTVLATVVVNNVPGICADINHKRTGGFRVQSLDLQELAKYFNKADAQVPSCTAGYYNYWKTPP